MKIINLLLILFFYTNMVYSATITQQPIQEDILETVYYNPYKNGIDHSYEIDGLSRENINFIILHYTATESYMATKEAYY